MADDRPDPMKAVNTTLTPPDEDLRRPDSDLETKPPLPEVVPIAEAGDEAVEADVHGRHPGIDPDASRRQASHPGTAGRRSEE